MANGLPEKQDNLDIQVKCSAIPEAVIAKAEITESISSLFKADVFLQTTKDIDTEKIINSIATISIVLDDQGNKRYFSGIVEEASFENVLNPVGARSDSILYIKIVPTFKRTLYSQKYRSFQELNAKDIIQKILKKDSITNLKLNIKSAGNTERTFCVQYGESDFHFISRLMEEEGIFYYFEHADSKDTLMISDMSSTCTKIGTELKVRTYTTNATITPDSIYNVSFSESMGTKKVEAFSYNEQKAEVISAQTSDSSKTKLAEKELYDPMFLEKSSGNDITKSFIESDNRFSKRLIGQSYCPEIYSGSIFKISGSKTEKHNGDFLMVSVKHHINQIPDDSGTPLYYNSFVAIPSNIPFRPIQTHFKNRIAGCQTATVTGTSGEKIFCDDQSRIKVKFHWDSRAKKDEKSSCWIRVAQSWAGNKFGGLIIPRVGMEVLVEFVNGDPDQPIVVGCLYNGVNKSPSNYAREKNTISTFYTNSSKGGGGFNELRFNDKAKEEEIFIHGQKDMNSVIENSVTETLNEGSKTVTLESKKGAVEHSLLIKKGKNTITLNDGDQVIVLDKGNQSITLKKGNQTVKLSNGDISIDVTGSISIKATKDINIEAKGAINIKSQNNTTIDSKASINVKAQLNYSLQAMNCKTQAQTSLELTSMTFKCTANVMAEITGMTLNLVSMGMMSVKSTGVLDITSGAAASVGAAAMLQLKGAILKLN